ncbi:MAG: 7-carboxy-7-deazaguanine synthase QueE [Cyanobacteria bacterium P01_A01_bin.17]
MSNVVPTPISTPDALTSSALTTAALVEIFSAIQGEGVNVGTRQIFIRFGGCDLRCRFCDSAHTWHPSETCRIEQTPGLRDFVTYPNPVSQNQLLTWIAQQNQPHLHDSISLTGGEPLLHSDFLRLFLPQVRDSTHLPIYLETGGHRPQDLQALLPHLDLIGMDLKLPSVSGETHWREHSQFLKLCQQNSVDVFCKVIVAQHTDPEDLQQVLQTIATISPKIPVYLQPVTPLPQSIMQPPTPAQVLQWQADLKQRLKTVRVVPQTHKMLDQL